MGRENLPFLLCTPHPALPVPSAHLPLHFWATSTTGTFGKRDEFIQNEYHAANQCVVSTMSSVRQYADNDVVMLEFFPRSIALLSEVHLFLMNQAITLFFPEQHCGI